MSEKDKFEYTKIATMILSDEWKTARCELSFYMRGGDGKQDHLLRVQAAVDKLVKDSQDYGVEWRQTFLKTYVPNVIAPPFTVVNFRKRDSY